MDNDLEQRHVRWRTRLIAAMVVSLLVLTVSGPTPFANGVIRPEIAHEVREVSSSAIFRWRSFDVAGVGTHHLVYGDGESTLSYNTLTGESVAVGPSALTYLGFSEVGGNIILGAKFGGPLVLQNLVSQSSEVLLPRVEVRSVATDGRRILIVERDSELRELRNGALRLLASNVRHARVDGEDVVYLTESGQLMHKRADQPALVVPVAGAGVSPGISQLEIGTRCCSYDLSDGMLVFGVSYGAGVWPVPAGAYGNSTFSCTLPCATPVRAPVGETSLSNLQVHRGTLLWQRGTGEIHRGPVVGAGERLNPSPETYGSLGPNNIGPAGIFFAGGYKSAALAELDGQARPFPDHRPEERAWVSSASLGGDVIAVQAGDGYAYLYDWRRGRVERLPGAPGSAGPRSGPEVGGSVVAWQTGSGRLLARQVAGGAVQTIGQVDGRPIDVDDATGQIAWACDAVSVCIGQNGPKLVVGGTVREITFRNGRVAISHVLPNIGASVWDLRSGNIQSLGSDLALSAFAFHGQRLYFSVGSQLRYANLVFPCGASCNTPPTQHWYAGTPADIETIDIDGTHLLASHSNHPAELFDLLTGSAHVLTKTSGPSELEGNTVSFLRDGRLLVTRSGGPSLPDPDHTPPAPPSALHAQADPGEVRLTWVNPGDADWMRITRRVVHPTRSRSQREIIVFDGPAAPTFTDREIGTGVTYRYTVALADGSGNYSGAAATEVKVPFRNSFADIGNSVFVDDIRALADLDIVTGCGGDRYCPLAPITRGEMAQVLARALRLPAPRRDHFDDDNGSSYEPSINALADAGVTSGCAPRRFCAADSFTRGQMATFLRAAFLLPSASRDYFTDDNANVHQENINRAREAGLTAGCSSSAPVYCPSDALTRGQIAALVRRALS